MTPVRSSSAVQSRRKTKQTRKSRRIKDEFSELNVSRQRKWQLRRQREGRCIICGKTTVSALFCLKHRVKEAVREHKRRYGKQTPRAGKWIKLAASVLEKPSSV